MMKTAIELAASLSARYLDTKQMLPDELAHEAAAMILHQAEQIEALEQAIGLEPRPKFTRFDVLVIITAYEQGYGKGFQDQGVPNGYAQHSPASQAWDLGYEEGQMRLKQQNREPKQ